MEAGWIAAGISFASLIILAGTHVWHGGKGYATDLSKMESRLTQTVAETARDMETRHDDIAKMVGDSIAAMREQMRLNEKEIVNDIHDLSERMSDVEKWARDEFVRKESFREVAARIETTVAEQGRSMQDAINGVRSAIMQYVARDHIDMRNGDNH